MPNPLLLQPNRKTDQFQVSSDAFGEARNRFNQWFWSPSSNQKNKRRYATCVGTLQIVKQHSFDEALAACHFCVSQ